LFAVEEKGNVVGRKLVAVNRRNEMVGFRTYVSYEDEGIRDIINSRMNAYCGSWARTCGLSLSNISTPEKLTGLFWYDDGLETWSPTVQAAWESGDYGLAMKSKSVLTSPLAEAAETYWIDCKKMLESIDLWPPPEGQDPHQLVRKAPELIEELLALIAEEKKDKELLVLLRRSVATNGGILRTLKALATIEGQAAIPEILQACGYRIPLIEEKIAGILADFGCQEAVDWLSSRCFKREWPSILELLVAVQYFPAAANAVAEFLLRERFWFCPPDKLLLIGYLIQETTGVLLKDRLLWKMFSHSNQSSTNSAGDAWHLPSLMAQWLPALQNPKQTVKLKNLEALWNNSFLEEEFPDETESIRIGVVLWCLRNPYQASFQFLRMYSDSDDAALLGLSITAGNRFERKIEKAFEANPERPAAIMSILRIKGVPEGLRFFESVKPRLHIGEDLLHPVIALYQAYETLDWQTISNIFKKLKGYDIKICLPWLMWNLWQRLEYPSKEVDIGQIAPGTSAIAVWDAGIDVFGLILQLALRLQHADEPAAIRYRQIIHALLGASARGGIDAGIRLWLDILSRHRLYTEDAMEIVANELVFNYNIAYSHAYELFFDSKGRRRPSARLLWSDYDSPRVFPFSLLEANRLAELMVEQPGLTDPEDFEPATEIEKRIVQRHLVRRNQ